MAVDARDLPAEVVKRLAAHSTEAGVVRGDRQVNEVRFKPEIRVDWEKRTAEINGYATVYDYPYDVAGGPPFGWKETIEGGAATRNVLDRDDVRFLINHDGIPLARTRSGTLHLESDDTGLRVRVPELDLNSPDVMSFVSAVMRGDMDEMSFAFRVGRQEWNGDYTERRIFSFDEIVDVSGVTYPANPATVMALRNESRRRRSGRRRPERTELKALPDVVLKRGLDLEEITTRRRGQELVEARLVLTPKLTVSEGDDTARVEGYLVHYDEPRRIGGDDGWAEIWATGACARNVNASPDVRLTLNGEGEPLSRSLAGTLTLRSDDLGLHIAADIDQRSEQGEALLDALQRGDDVDARVSFDVVKQRWEADHSERRIEEVALHDMAFLSEPDPAGDLSHLHNSRSLLEGEPDNEHMSIALAKAIRERLAL